MKIRQIIIVMDAQLIACSFYVYIVRYAQ